MSSLSINNQQVQIRYFAILVFSFFLATPLLWLFFSSEIEDIKLDNKIAIQLAKIRQHSAELSKFILRSRSNIDNSFDSISSAQKRLQANAINLYSPLIQDNNLTKLSQATNKILNDKVNSAERFKSLHAKIKNSLRYLPVIEDNILKNIHQNEFIKKSTKSILINSFNYRLFNDDRFLNGITSELKALLTHSKNLEKAEQDLVTPFISHSELLLTLRKEESLSIETLLSNDLSIKVSSLEANLVAIKNQAAERTKNIKIYLLIYSGILFIITLIFLINRYKLISSVLKHKNLSQRDQLTGLNNRRYFLRILEKSFHSLDQSQQYNAIIFIDLDGFKAINDNLGHNCGDKVLQSLAERFLLYIDKKSARGVEVHAARLGGDEFVFLVDKLDRDEISQSISSIAQDLLKMCSDSLGSEFKGFPLSASIGIAIYPEHGDNVKDILNAADKAMYHSKHTGKNCFTLYQTNMN